MLQDQHQQAQHELSRQQHDIEKAKAAENDLQQRLKAVQASSQQQLTKLEDQNTTLQVGLHRSTGQCVRLRGISCMQQDSVTLQCMLAADILVGTNFCGHMPLRVHSWYICMSKALSGKGVWPTSSLDHLVVQKQVNDQTAHVSELETMLQQTSNDLVVSQAALKQHKASPPKSPLFKGKVKQPKVQTHSAHTLEELQAELEELKVGSSNRASLCRQISSLE